MGDSDHRQIARDSLFVLADLRLDGVDGLTKVKVRNLSAGGMMAEGKAKVQRGQAVWVDIRNIGWIEGNVAWVQENRFGIAFDEDIDPKVALAPVAVDPQAEMILRRPNRSPFDRPFAQVRKI